MAHKKAGGSTNNGRDSVSKRLGVKRFGGQIGDQHLNQQIKFKFNEELVHLYMDLVILVVVFI